MARLGGDEFGVLLPGPAAVRAAEVASRLRDGLGRSGRIDDVVTVSAGIGWGQATDGPGIGRALAAADHSVYDDKHGRGASRA